MITRMFAGLMLGACVLPATLHAEEASAFAQTDPAEEAGAAPAEVTSTTQSTLLSGFAELFRQEPDTRPLAGADTDAYLALQRDGAMASGNPQAASLELREKAAARFMKTYDQAIPEVRNAGFKTN